MIDSKPPVLGPVPKDVDLDCDGGNIPPAITVNATDNCDTDVEVVLTETETPGLCDGAYTITHSGPLRIIVAIHRPNNRSSQ
ncbi:MAG: hypothetical protein IPJ06_05400 [Saprospiraceae bacterium]|nr:hypothetical protein [Saprospiraceae bacterium]